MRNYATFQDLTPSTFGSSTSTSILVGIDTDTGNALELTTGLKAIIYNPFDSSSFTFVEWQGAINVHGFGGAGAKAIACHKNAEQITGVNFRAGASASPNSIDSIKAYVYGYR